MTHVNRVAKGVSTAGQFSTAAHPEASLHLAPEPAQEGFNYDFEATNGKRLTSELKALHKVSRWDAGAAAELTDALRETYGDYYADGEPQISRTAAVGQVEQHLPNLSPSRREHHLQLMQFAVHTELKHFTDTDYVSNTEHDYELLIDPGNYPEIDQDPGQAHQDNSQAWSLLADTAAAHALAENRAAELSAVA